MGNSVNYIIQAQDKTGAGTKSAGNNFKSVDKMVGGLKVGLFAATAAAVGIMAAVNKVATSMDDMAKAAKRVGMTVDAFDAWSYVVQLSGGNVETLSKSIKVLDKNMFDITMGAGQDARRAFEAMGISVTTATGELKNAESMVLEVATAFETIESAEKKAAIAQKVFGRVGIELVPMLNQGSDAIREQLIQARVLGTRYSDMTGKGEDLKDAQLRLNMSIRNVGDAIMVYAIPGLASLTDWLSIQLINALTRTDEEFRRFVAGLRIGDPEYAVEDLTAALQDLEKQYARVSDEWDPDVFTLSNPYATQQDVDPRFGVLEGQIAFVKIQLKQAQEQLDLQNKIREQTKRRRLEVEALNDALAEDIPMPIFPVWVDPDSHTTFEDLFFTPPEAETIERVRELTASVADLTREQEIAGQAFDAVWGSMLDGPEAMGKAMQRLGMQLAGAVIKKMIMDKIAGKAGAGVKVTEAIAGYHAAYSAIPFAGPAIAQGFIGKMYADMAMGKGVAAGMIAAAEGGSFQSGQSVLVGERGPEIVNFRQPGQVIPNHAIGGSGGMSLVVHINGDFISDDTTKDNLARELYSRVQAMGYA